MIFGRVGFAHHACPERVEVVGQSPTYSFPDNIRRTP